MRVFVKLSALLLLLLSAFDGFAAAPSTTAKPAVTKLRMSQSAVNTRSAVLWIAKGQGSFAKYGLDVETIYLRSSNLQMTAMATGEVQFGSSGGAPVFFGCVGRTGFENRRQPEQSTFL